MSLGWNTESALLPSKAKKIEVDQRSMFDLKAIVSEKEEHTKQNFLLKEHGGFRQNRGASGNINIRNKNDDIFFSKSNQGIDARNAKDLYEIQQEKKRKSNKSNLEKKVELYNKIKRGEISTEKAQNAGFLVNFDLQEDETVDMKLKTEENSENKANFSQIQDCLNDKEEIEIQDEFGRSIFVLKNSQQYEMKLKIEQDEAIKQQLLEEKEYALQDQGGMSERQRSTNSIIESEEQHSSSQWPVSSGRGRQDCGEWDQSLAPPMAKEKGKGLEDFEQETSYHHYGKEDKSSDEVVGVGGVNGRVKSKWEYTLSSTEKAYLRDISQETTANRAAKAQLQHHDVVTKKAKRDVKAERRELLRKKREAREALASKEGAFRIRAHSLHPSP